MSQFEIHWENIAECRNLGSCPGLSHVRCGRLQNRKRKFVMCRHLGFNDSKTPESHEQTLVPEMGSNQQRPPGFSTLESQKPAAQAAQAARGRPPCVAQYSRRASQFSHLGIAGKTESDTTATNRPLR